MFIQLKGRIKSPFYELNSIFYTVKKQIRLKSLQMENRKLLSHQLLYCKISKLKVYDFLESTI